MELAPLLEPDSRFYQLVQRRFAGSCDAEPRPARFARDSLAAVYEDGWPGGSDGVGDSNVWGILRSAVLVMGPRSRGAQRGVRLSPDTWAEYRPALSVIT